MADAANATATAAASAAASGPSTWFPTQPDNAPGPWRLDVVTLLAVIGESSMAEHSQAITASVLCLLPRLMPAPQALLKPTRPVRLPETHAKMTGVYSGMVLDTVGFFANIIHPLDECKPFMFRELRISHKDRNEAGGYVVGGGGGGGAQQQGNNAGDGETSAAPGSPFGLFRRASSVLSGSGRRLSDARRRRIPGPPKDEESGVATTAPSVRFALDVDGTAAAAPSADATGTAGPEDAPVPGIVRRRTVQETVTDMLANPTTIAQRKGRPAVPPTLYSPVNLITVLSCLLSVSIVAFAVYWRDANAALAVGLVSLASSVVGIASWWKPILMNRSHTNKVPDGDVVIRTREGAFILVRCTEEVTRELYSSLEECQYYVGGRVYRLLMALGTVMLMVSVILLGNCNFPSQVFIGTSYIILNCLYWAMGMLPKRYFWDLDRYLVEDVTAPDSRRAHENDNEHDEREGCKSYTRTLWYVIRETKTTGWVERGGAAPRTPQWKAWLAEAERAARDGNRTWSAVGRKDDIMRAEADGLDRAEQVAPATFVQNNSQNPSF